MSEMCRCAPATAKKSVDELVEGGFLKEERKGRSRGNAASRERIASLTRYDTDTVAGDPNLPIKIWKKNSKSDASNKTKARVKSDASKTPSSPQRQLEKANDNKRSGRSMLQP
ncbi:MAG: hypothetical protein DHS20C06_06460 [Hyphobacterium sp.]|nr:MAG: hypothetical protein DHS20C06_06460 [Hyphobacterium sp.]